MMSTFLSDVLGGLAACPPTLPCKYFYDQRGSRLFDQICELPEYYLTRSEQAVLERHRGEIVATVSDCATMAELGSGSSIKTRMLLDRLPGLRRYLPIDISAAHLLETAQDLRRRYPHLDVDPMVADYAEPLPPLPALQPRTGERTVVFFPGSSLGNFHPPGAIRLLAEMRRMAGPTGVILLGLDPGRDVAAIQRAYNDDAGVTAAFNLNLLGRINRELGGDIVVERFRHDAVWESDHRRIEMRLVSTAAQRIAVGDRTFGLRAGDAIVTEHCYKYTRDALARLAAAAELVVRRTWADPEHGMELHELAAA
jgi:dimethylhistidine N-methyltransferase